MEKRSIFIEMDGLFTLESSVDFRLLMKQFCEFYSRNSQEQYYIYIRTFLIAITYAIVGDLILGVSEKNIVVGCIVITFVSLIASPFMHSLTTSEIYSRQVRSAHTNIVWTSLLSTFISITRLLFILLTLSFVVYAAFAINDLRNTISTYTAQGIREVALSRLWYISYTLGIMLILMIASLTYLSWKSRRLHFVEARLGAVKDIIIRVEHILRDNRQPLETRNMEAIMIVLKGLRVIIRLNPYERIWKIIRSFKPGENQTTVVYAMPEPSKGYFQIKYSAYPNEAPERVREAFEWIKENHHPRFLNEREFIQLLSLAKGTFHKGWKDRYLNFSGRAEFVSEYGWIYAKDEVLFSRNAARSLVFDDRFIEQVKSLGLEPKEVRWLEIGSFIGCPVPGPDNRPIGVLLVQNNLPNRLRVSDYEVVILASQIISRILNVKQSN